jgi:hypothetical protein
VVDNHAEGVAGGVLVDRGGEIGAASNADTANVDERRN